MKLSAALEYEKLREDAASWNNDSFNIRCELFMNPRFLRYGTFDRYMTVYELSKPTTA